MTKEPDEPVRTHRLFQHDRVAAGYASARPFLHPAAFARVRDLVPLDVPLGRALDVGCGTGMSSVALLDLAREVVGIDASVDMLRHARRAEGLRLVASTAEDLPFGRGRFDLIAACGSMDWVDRSRFLPRAAELLASGGWLVSLDFGDAGRSPTVPGLESWYRDAFRRAFPPPPARDPILTADDAERHGFAPPVDGELALGWRFTAPRYADFLLTESSVIAAVEYGRERADRIQTWLRSELAPLFGDGAHEVAFSGYIQALPKL